MSAAPATPMRTAFVTGAYGMLGYWLVRALLQRDVAVVVLRREGSSRSALELDGLHERCAVVTGDLLDDAALERAIAGEGADTVFHLAGQTIVGVANRSPAPTFDTNIRGTWTLLEACRRHGVARTVVAGSDKAYGSRAELPYRETHALQARFPYDVSKACADLIARSYFHTFALPVAVTRFANVYGGGDLNPSRLVPELVAAVLGGRAPVIRSDGSPERDFLYVEDAVAAYLAIADALGDGDGDGDGGGAAGEAFNGGGGAPRSVREVVEVLVRVTGAHVEPEFRGEGTPPGEIDREWVDATKLRELTGWAPGIDLEEGLRRTVDWYRAHPQALPA